MGIIEKGLLFKSKYKTLLSVYHINTDLRLCHFLSQISHESRLKPIEENLRYSAKRLLQVFPKYFNKEQAELYAFKPKNIANRVYSNRMGNGNELSGDGYAFRGRGFIQLTGRDNYTKLSKSTGIDYVNNPDLLLREADAMIAALWYWNSRGISRVADNDDVKEVTRRINGGYNGLEDRKSLLYKWKKEFGI